MNYELAKQLEDAGFIYTGHLYGRPDGKTMTFHDLATKDGMPGTIFPGWEEGVGLPTLSELIEACGKAFGHLGLLPNGWWEADAEEDRNRYETEETPEEAVARLWIALNAKV